MDINATLLVQAVNFSVFYVLIRSLLFKPVVHIIETDAGEVAKKIDAIGQQKKSIDIKEKERQHYWQLNRDYLKSQWPMHDLHTDLMRCDQGISPKELFKTEHSDDEINCMIEQIKTHLEEKIKHVH